MYEVWCPGCQGPHDPDKHNKNISTTSATPPGKPKAAPNPVLPEGDEFNLIPGKTVWVQARNTDLSALTITGGGLLSNWKRAVISSRYGDSLTLIPDIDNKRQQQSFVPLSSYQITDTDNVFPANDSIVPDLTQLRFIHEPAILWNIKKRAEWRTPYTFMGEVLISVNPLQDVERLAKAANAEPNYLFDPHPRTVAERALRRMRFGIKERKRQGRSLDEPDLVPINQAIIISGESGSGKTESAKRVLAQLVEGFEEEGEDGMAQVGVQERILGSEPILEAFGNAATEKNANSSRFGKFLKVYYTIDEEDFVELRGAKIVTYLLEKSRVCTLLHTKPLPKGTRAKARSGVENYRVFYNILSAGTTDLDIADALGLSSANFNFPFVGGQYIFEAKDKSQYLELSAALAQANLSVPLLRIYEVVGGILHLGNLLKELESFQTEQGDVARISDKSGKSKEIYDPLFWSATLLGLESKDLEATLLHSKVKIGREEMTKSRTVADAEKLVQSIAMKLYELLFDWIVFQLNETLWDQGMESDGVSNEDCNFVGILDIFGFETFTTNGFEQLLINYANELLQNVFTDQIIISEAELFKREGVVITTSKADENKNVIVRKSANDRFKFFDTIFSMLDNSMKVPSPSDQKFLREIQKKLRRDRLFIMPHRKDINHKFLIRHFAGSVEYSIGDFQTKNQDSVASIQEAFSTMLRASKNPVITQLTLLAPSSEKMPGKIKPSISRNESKTQLNRKSLYKSVRSMSLSKSKFQKLKTMKTFKSLRVGNKAKKKQTTSSSFKTDMSNLEDTLRSCGCSYIRCLKPNPTMTPPTTASATAFGRRSATRENVSELYNFYGYKKAESVLKSRRYNRNKQLMNRPNVSNHYKVLASMGAVQNQDEYFNSEYVTRQLHCLGVFDAVKVLKTGLPTRIPFGTFIDTFKDAIPLSSSLIAQRSSKGKDYIAALLWAFQVPQDCYRLGETLVFFRFGQLDFVSSILSSAGQWDKRVITSNMKINELLDVDSDVNDTGDSSAGIHNRMEIAQRFRTFFVRRLWRKAFTGTVAVNHFLQLYKRSHAVRKIQSMVREYFDRQDFAEKLRLNSRAIDMQRVFRGHLARIRVNDLRLKLKQKEKAMKKSLEIERRKKSRIDDFESHQTLQRNKLDMQRKRELEKYKRIEKKAEKWQIARQLQQKQEHERMLKLEAKEDAMRNLLLQEETIRKKKETHKKEAMLQRERFQTDLQQEMKKSETMDAGSDSEDSIGKIDDVNLSEVKPVAANLERPLRSLSMASKLSRESRGKPRAWRRSARRSTSKMRQQLLSESEGDKKSEVSAIEQLTERTAAEAEEHPVIESPEAPKFVQVMRKTKSKNYGERQSHLRRLDSAKEKRNSENMKAMAKSGTTVEPPLPPSSTKPSSTLHLAQETMSVIEDNGSQTTDGLHDEDFRLSILPAYDINPSETKPEVPDRVGGDEPTYTTEVDNSENETYATDIPLGKQFFNERYEILQQKLLSIKKEHKNSRSGSDTWNNTFRTLQEGNLMQSLDDIEIEALGPVEPTTKEIDPVKVDESATKREWVGRKRSQVPKYKQLQKTLKFPGQKKKKAKLNDPALISKLEKFVQPETYKLQVVAFTMFKKPASHQTGKSTKRGGRYRSIVSSGSSLGATSESFATYLSEVAKKPENRRITLNRSVRLQKLTISPGAINIAKVKPKKRRGRGPQVPVSTKYQDEISVMIDHKCKIHIKRLEEEDLTPQAKKKPIFEVFLEHVPSGLILCFQFPTQKSRDEWYHELRKSQLSFFGNDILDMPMRRLLQKLDVKLKTITLVGKKGKRMDAEISELFQVLKTKDDTRGSYVHGKIKNPKFNESGKARKRKQKAKGGILNTWTKAFLQLGEPKVKEELPQVAYLKPKNAKKRETRLNRRARNSLI